MATAAATLAVGGVASAAHAPVGLGNAESYAVLAGQTITNTGPSVISGDLGLSPGTAVTGFPPGILTSGEQNVANAVADGAQSDLTTAYNDAAGRSSSGNVADGLGGRTLVDGTYTTAAAMDLTGTVTLDAQGDPNAVFIFQAGSTLITASGSTVSLINGADPCNVFWQVGSSATLGTDTTFVGTVMASASISAQTGTDVEGRLLARDGAVTLDTNTITAPSCATTTPPSETSEPASPTPPTEPSEPSEPSEPTSPTEPSEPTATTEPSEPTSETPPTEPSEPTSAPSTPPTTVSNAVPIIPVPIPIPLLPPTEPGQPPAGPDQPSDGPGQPPADAGQPPAGPGQPPADAGQPPAGPGQPSEGPGQPPTDAGLPPAGPGQPSGGQGYPVGGGHIIPKGYPDTGAGGTAPASDNSALLVSLAALALVGSGIAASQAIRLRRRN